MKNSIVNTKIKGDVTELLCIAEFRKLGFEVSVPYGNNARYDLIVDTGEKLLRVQCKTSRYLDDDKSWFGFDVHSNRKFSTKYINKTYDKDQIDLFATYINNRMYVIPVEECLKNKKTIRISPPKNRKDYLNPERYFAENFFNEDYIYKDPEEDKIIEKRLKHICPVCGNEVWKEGSLCRSCAAKLKSDSSKIIPREELKDLIRKFPATEIGKQFGVSDVSIIHWCKKHNLPHNFYKIKKISDEEWEKI